MKTIFFCFLGLTFAPRLMLSIGVDIRIFGGVNTHTDASACELDLFFEILHASFEGDKSWGAKKYNGGGQKEIYIYMYVYNYNI